MPEERDSGKQSGKRVWGGGAAGRYLTLDVFCFSCRLYLRVAAAMSFVVLLSACLSRLCLSRPVCLSVCSLRVSFIVVA